MAQAEVDYIPQKRWWLKPLIFLVVLGLLGVAGYLAYRRYEPDRLSRKAREFLEKGDTGSALLSLRRALQLNPNSESASQMMAEITSGLDSPVALEWQRKLVELNPDSAPEAFTWAGTAVRLGQVAVAEKALAAVPERERHTARYHTLKGTLALHEGKTAEAERSFAEALRLQPGSELHRYNLATLQLQSPDAAKRTPARDTLQELARGGAMQAVARRSMVTYLLGEGDPAAALAYSGPLVATEAARFSDRIVHLQLLSRTKSELLATDLAAVQKHAEKRPDDVALLLHWMRTSALGDEAIKWIKALDSTVASSGPVASARADILLAKKDWTALRENCTAGDWGNLNYLRLAFLARAERERGNTAGARAQWTAASSAAARDRHKASRLAWIAQNWGWTEEVRETLWAATSSPASDWAVDLLHKSYQAEGNTGGLLRVAIKVIEGNPADEPARNNVAMLSLLRGERLQAALDDATSLYKKSPDHPGIASTYAFALHVHGRTDEGLEIMQKLDPKALLNPSIAAYYGLLLAAKGDLETAKPYLDLGKRAQLLPEERALLGKATVTKASPPAK